MFFGEKNGNSGNQVTNIIGTITGVYSNTQAEIPVHKVIAINGVPVFRNTYQKALENVASKYKTLKTGKTSGMAAGIAKIGSLAGISKSSWALYRPEEEDKIADGIFNDFKTWLNFEDNWGCSQKQVIEVIYNLIQKHVAAAREDRLKKPESITEQNNMTRYDDLSTTFVKSIETEMNKLGMPGIKDDWDLVIKQKLLENRAKQMITAQQGTQRTPDQLMFIERETKSVIQIALTNLVSQDESVISDMFNNLKAKATRKGAKKASNDAERDAIFEQLNQIFNQTIILKNYSSGCSTQEALTQSIMNDIKDNMQRLVENAESQAREAKRREGNLNAPMNRYRSLSKQLFECLHDELTKIALAEEKTQQEAEANHANQAIWHDRKIVAGEMATQAGEIAVDVAVGTVQIVGVILYVGFLILQAIVEADSADDSYSFR